MAGSMDNKILKILIWRSTRCIDVVSNGQSQKNDDRARTPISDLQSTHTQMLKILLNTSTLFQSTPGRLYWPASNLTSCWCHCCLCASPGFHFFSYTCLLYCRRIKLLFYYWSLVLCCFLLAIALANGDHLGFYMGGKSPSSDSLLLSILMLVWGIKRAERIYSPLFNLLTPLPHIAIALCHSSRAISLRSSSLSCSCVYFN